MPTLTELRALLDSQGKPICDEDGNRICGNCPPLDTGGCAEPCPEWVCNVSDYCLTIKGVQTCEDLPASTDLAIPMRLFCLEDGSIYQWTGRYAYPSPSLPYLLCYCGAPFFMDVTIWCSTFDETLPKEWKWSIAYGCCDTCPGGPGPTDSDWRVEGTLTKACPKLTAGPFRYDAPAGGRCTLAFDSLELAPGSCGRNLLTHNCDPGEGDPPPLVGVPPPPPPPAIDCCDTVPDADALYIATVTPNGQFGVGLPDVEDCDTCSHAGSMAFRWVPGSGPAGEDGFVGTMYWCSRAAPTWIPTIYFLVVRVFCHEASWIADAIWWAPHLGSFRPLAAATWLLQVTPCSIGYPKNYFELAVINDAFSAGLFGFPCYGGFFIVMGA